MSLLCLFLLYIIIKDKMTDKVERAEHKCCEVDLYCFYTERAVQLLHGSFVYERLSFLVSADYDVGIA